MFRSISKIVKSINRKLKGIIELNKYNDFTIAEYFRKQGANIGEDNRIEVRGLGAEPYLVSIGNHCTIARNVKFLTHDGAVWLFTEEFPSLQKFGTITILDNCFVGIDAIIMGNVTIGPNSVVGAGSVVTKDVPPGVVAAGNPARVISSIEQYREKALRLWQDQKPPGYFKDLQDGKKYPASFIQDIKYRDLPLLKEHLSRYFKRKTT